MYALMKVLTFKHVQNMISSKNLFKVKSKILVPLISDIFIWNAYNEVIFLLFIGLEVTLTEMCK